MRAYQKYIQTKGNNMHEKNQGWLLLEEIVYMTIQHTLRILSEQNQSNRFLRSRLEFWLVVMIKVIVIITVDTK